MPEITYKELMGNSYFTIIATGKTYPIKGILQGWGFFWDKDRKAWVNNYVDYKMIQYFMQKIAKGHWPEIILSCIKQED